MSQFIFDFLPSIYKDFFVNENGNNILLPLFDQYTKCVGDLIFQAQQINNMSYLEKCPIYIKEYYKTIDVKFSNKYTKFSNSYIIEDSIIGFSELYYDSLFTIPVTTSFSINKDDENVTYITFDQPLNITTNTIFTEYCIHNKNTLKDTFGKLLNYQPNFPFMEFGEDYINTYEKYRSQLIALSMGLIKGQTVQNIKQSLGMFLGLKYSPFSAIVRNNDGSSIILENVLDGSLQTIYGNINSTYLPGALVDKFEILENYDYKIYDMYLEPARFTQYILSNYSEKLLELLSIKTNDNEKYAYLSFDSIISFDANNIYFDMGNNTGINHDIPINATEYSFPTPLVTNFSAYNDSRFQSQKIYEMFRNLFILEFLNSEYQETVDNAKYFLSRIKPIYTKFLIYAYIGGLG